MRSWSVDRERSTLSLVLGPENRWCAHVQRFHRSNGISLRADLRPGRRCLVQHCFDADCRAAGFRGSDELPIPPEVCPPEGSPSEVVTAGGGSSGAEGDRVARLSQAAAGPAGGVGGGGDGGDGGDGGVVADGGGDSGGGDGGGGDDDDAFWRDEQALAQIDEVVRRSVEADNPQSDG